MDTKRIGGRLLLWAAFAFLAIFSAGCRSDQYYQDLAVRRARAYLLKHSPELTADQIYFVKYNNPFFLTADVLGKGGLSLEGAMESRQQQICVTWAIPGRDRYYMVFGVSSGRMDTWYPNRLIHRVFTLPNRPLESAVSTARTYAQNALYSRMNTEEFNSVRFTLPYLRLTNFDLAINPEMTLTPEEYKKEARKLASSCQFSLVWKMDPASGESMVFCGTAGPNLAGWKINFAGRMPDAEVEAHTVELLKTPKDSFADFTPVEPPLPPEEEPMMEEHAPENSDHPVESEKAEKDKDPAAAGASFGETDSEEEEAR